MTTLVGYELEQLNGFLGSQARLARVLDKRPEWVSRALAAARGGRSLSIELPTEVAIHNLFFVAEQIAPRLGEDFRSWLLLPRAELDGATPAEVARRGDSKRVIEVLEAQDELMLRVVGERRLRPRARLADDGPNPGFADAVAQRRHPRPVSDGGRIPITVTSSQKLKPRRVGAASGV